MTEYTITVVLAGILVYALDKYLHTHVLPPSKALQKTMLAFLVAQLVFDNLFTWQGIWKFNPQHNIGLFLPYIPLENVVFGQELLLVTIILYSFFVHRTK